MTKLHIVGKLNKYGTHEKVVLRGRSVGGRKGNYYRGKGYDESADELLTLIRNLFLV